MIGSYASGSAKVVEVAKDLCDFGDGGVSPGCGREGAVLETALLMSGGCMIRRSFAVEAR